MWRNIFYKLESIKHRMKLHPAAAHLKVHHDPQDVNATYKVIICEKLFGKMQIKNM